jgi:glycosyltransferase involved in cell wall biosynthesis
MISAIMPYFNAEKHLAESIESVLNQTNGNFELLMINDKSTDKSEQISSEYARGDSRVRLIRNTGIKGIVGSLNLGLQKASGEFIARCDADDINRPYRFENQVAFLNATPRIVLVGGGYAPFNENGTRRHIYHPTSSVEIAWRYISDSYFCHPTVMFRSWLVEEFGGYPNCIAEDFVYFSKIVKKYRCANLHSILVDYRESASSLSNVGSQAIAECVKNEFHHNYEYYLGHGRGADVFFEFQRYGKAPVNQVARLIAANLRILMKIRMDYQLSPASIELWAMFHKILRSCLLQSVQTASRKIVGILRLARRYLRFGN